MTQEDKDALYKTRDTVIKNSETILWIRDAIEKGDERHNGVDSSIEKLDDRLRAVETFAAKVMAITAGLALVVSAVAHGLVAWISKLTGGS